LSVLPTVAFSSSSFWQLIACSTEHLIGCIWYAHDVDTCLSFPLLLFHHLHFGNFVGVFPSPCDASKAKMAKQEWSDFVDKAWKKSQMRSSDVKFNGLLMESGERSNEFNVCDCIHGKTKAQHHVTVFHDSSKQPSSKHPLCLAKVFAVCTTNFLRRKCLLLRI
jgi:hypothetical protein